MNVYVKFSLLILLVIASLQFVQPAQAQGFTITPSSTSVTATMSSSVSVTVTITRFDSANHTVTLFTYNPSGLWSVSFTPIQLTVTSVQTTATSTMTITTPGASDICPSQTSSGPYSNTILVQARDVSTSAQASTSLSVNLQPSTSLINVNVEAGGPYRVGDTVSLTLSSNVPAQYSLKVKKPDGTTWATSDGTLPDHFSKTASEPIGTYTAELTAYYCGTKQDSDSFTVSPNTYGVSISLAGLPNNSTTQLYVDGNKIADMTGTSVQSYSYPIGTVHTFQVSQYVNGFSDHRFYSHSNTWTTILDQTGASQSFVFNYVAQYYLEIRTDPSSVTAVSQSDWFTSGAQASIGSVPAIIQVDDSTRYAFKEWTIDGTPTSGNGFTVTMNAPHVLVARYDTQYLLTLVSDYGNPQGAGWYNFGSKATITVTSPVNDGYGVKYVLIGWKGYPVPNDVTVGSTISVTMDSPKTLTATWYRDSTQLYLTEIFGVAVVAVLIVWYYLRKRRIEGAPTEVQVVKPEQHTSDAQEKHCEKCGFVLAENVHYCPECGTKR